MSPRRAATRRGEPLAVGALVAAAVGAGAGVRRPARQRHRMSSSTSRRCRAAGSRALGRSTCRRASSPTATSKRRGRSSPTTRSTSCCGRRTSSTRSTSRPASSSSSSPPRRLASASRSPSGSPRTCPARPGRVTNAQVVVTPDGQVTSRYDKVRRVPFGEYVPLRGLLEALGAPVDQVPTNAVAGTGPAVIELPDGTPLGGGDLVGGVLRRPGSGGREERRRGASSTRPTGPATRARSCRPSRSRRAGCGRSRPGGGSCRCRRPGSPSSSRPTAT